MKQRITSLITVLILLLAVGKGHAQSFSNPVEYLDYLGAESARIQQESWDYTSKASHGKSARKVEKQRKVLLSTIGEARGKVLKMPGWEGYTDLRDSVASFLRVYYFVINEDYQRIMDLEEVADQSPDLMEAYILAQQIANEKLQRAGTRMEEAQQAYADEFDIRLTESERTELQDKMKKANELYRNYNQHFLIQLRVVFQEGRMVNASNEGDINAMEQTINTLLDVVDAARETLTEVSNFDGDRSLAAATGDLLDFAEREAKVDFPKTVDFFLLQEKVGKARDNMPKKPSEAQVNEFNAMVKELNESINDYNERNARLNKERGKLMEAWSRAGQKFKDSHVPK